MAYYGGGNYAAVNYGGQISVGSVRGSVAVASGGGSVVISGGEVWINGELVVPESSMSKIVSLTVVATLEDGTKQEMGPPEGLVVEVRGGAPVTIEAGSGSVTVNGASQASISTRSGSVTFNMKEGGRVDRVDCTSGSIEVYGGHVASARTNAGFISCCKQGRFI